jgi:hypothetical protein
LHVFAAKGLNITKLAFIASDDIEGDLGGTAFLSGGEYKARLASFRKSGNLRLMTRNHHLGD